MRDKVAAACRMAAFSLLCTAIALALINAQSFAARGALGVNPPTIASDIAASPAMAGSVRLPQVVPANLTSQVPLPSLGGVLNAPLVLAGTSAPIAQATATMPAQAVIHPLAAPHLPPFITAPGETDVLMNVVLGFLVSTVLFILILYFRLHALPEHIAHNSQKVQYEIVAVLALLSLFTHNHIYWIVGLLLALVRLPDFSTPLSGMAHSLEKIAESQQRSPTSEPTSSRPRSYVVS